MKQFAVLLVFVSILVSAGFIGALRLVLALTHTVPFYAGIFSLTFICLVILLASLLSLKRSSVKAVARGGRVDVERSLERIVACVLCAFAANLSFFVVVPVTVDRSVSTFLLSRMPPVASGRSMTKQELRDTFVSGFVDDLDAIGRRLEEQRVGGNIREIAPGEYVRTERAEGFLTFGRAVAKIYGLNSAYVGD